MVRTSPTIQVSPPLGAVSAREPRILKFAGDVCVTVASLLRVILTLTAVEIASGTVQAKLPPAAGVERRSEEHTSELQSRLHLVCRLLLEKKKDKPARSRRLRQSDDLPDTPAAQRRHPGACPRDTQN